ncbi:TetR/AcrR family transcriptional regulator [Hyphomonas johnsonii]|uniref:TetR family transcriptional regulator n=1 Tax=Hyphomonas johnsonii MHS-2 TaxID=1280950 RepID=A0A059FBE0_9PROT|nr:TetR/AcrR family transcriptional regulator [Hyphomonas johnsonii]KCZ87925.1 TetR family transcriptional regulator [Hyphomonas johnsonii MHS-2]
MVTAAPGKRERAKAERRSRIVRAARDLIRETGDTDLSMRMIAKRADVSLATPYNLFGSKHAVVLAVFEDERDFAERFSKLKADNALERLFDAHALATSYFTEDPDFYRPLWKALLDVQGAKDTGLATPERLERNSQAWEALISDAQQEGLLAPAYPADTLERMLSLFANGVMLSWSMGALATDKLLPTAALGYALVLRGAATPRGMKILANKIQAFQSIL